MFVKIWRRYRRWIQNHGDNLGQAPPIVIGISSDRTQFEVAQFSYSIPQGTVSLISLLIMLAASEEGQLLYN
jgi:hypothetical protein